MSKKLLAVTVRGSGSTWTFHTYQDPKYLPEWWADGLEIYEVCNTIPLWLPNWIPVQWWCVAQDLFNFKWPWGKS